MLKISSEFITLIIILIIIFIILNFSIRNPHPILITILLVFYRIITCLIISKWSQNFIYSIILFLIIISGLLIIFLYFSRLVSNEQNNLIFKPLIIINFSLNLVILSFLYTNYSYKIPIYIFIETIQINYLNTPLFQNITYIYSSPFNNLTIICILYLLITLLIIIKICSTKNISLRKLK